MGPGKDFFVVIFVFIFLSLRTQRVLTLKDMLTHSFFLVLSSGTEKKHRQRLFMYFFRMAQQHVFLQRLITVGLGLGLFRSALS